MSANELEGGCLCGAIRFRVSGESSNRCCCHCRSCRLASGAPFVAWATYPCEAFRVTSGKLAQHVSSADASRGFCAVCGTSISYAHAARPGQIDVSVATLDEPAALAPEFHIWVSHKIPWLALEDGLPRHPEWRTENP